MSTSCLLLQELSPVSVSALVGSAVDRQPDGSEVPSSRMHAVTLDSLRVRPQPPGIHLLFHGCSMSAACHIVCRRRYNQSCSCRGGQR